MCFTFLVQKGYPIRRPKMAFLSLKAGFFVAAIRLGSLQTGSFVHGYQRACSQARLFLPSRSDWLMRHMKEGQ